MALLEGQVQIRDLVMGPGTAFTLREFNPFNRNIRASQGGERPWDDGSWYGAEFLGETSIPFKIFVKGASKNTAAWLNENFKLMQAFDAVGSTGQDVEMRFMLGGTEYLMVGRPRVVNPETNIIGTGQSMTEAVFVASNPRIYSSELQTAVVQIARFTSGFATPMSVPLYVHGIKIGGEASLTNNGIADTPLILRVDGPVASPSITIRNPDGTTEKMTIGFDLTASQWVDINTANNLVLLEGTANRRRDISGDFMRLKPGNSTIFFTSGEPSEEALLTVSWRHAW